MSLALIHFEFKRAIAVSSSRESLVALLFSVPFILMALILGTDNISSSLVPQTTIGIISSLFVSNNTVEQNNETALGDYWAALENNVWTRGINISIAWLAPAVSQGLVLVLSYSVLIDFSLILYGIGAFFLGFALGTIPGFCLAVLAFRYPGIRIFAAIFMISLIVFARFLTSDLSV